MKCRICDKEAEEEGLCHYHLRFICRCGSGQPKYELLDANGIFCAYVCSMCEEKEKSKYNSWVFTGYDQDFLDQYSGERIEPLE